MGEQLEATVPVSVPVAPRAGRGLARPLDRFRHPALAAVVAWLEREAFLVVLLGIYLVGMGYDLPRQVVSDTWMTLAYGREVVQHGLPSHDALTVMAHGRTWVDQQWLGQLAYYGAFVLGGIRAVLALNAFALASAAALAFVAARRLGGSTRSVTWLALGSLLVIAGNTWVVRVQALVFPLFVALLWLLAADSRNRSRKVFLAFPILVLWANVHGTAFLGAGLIALRGLTMLLERDRPLRARIPTAAALLASPVLLLASPYGLQAADYYHRLLLNPAFSHYVTEWAPTRLGIATTPFYLLTLLAAWLAGRCRSRLTLFEQGALLLTLVLAWLAVRSVAWFMLSALVLLPVALDGVLKRQWDSPRYRLVNRLLAVPTPFLCLWIFAASFAHPTSSYTRDFPTGAADAVARVAAVDPGARVFANERYADWLVLEHPELRGRIAFDGRFELLTTKELRRIVEFRFRIAGATSVTRGYELLVLNASTEKKLGKFLLASPSRHALFRNHVLVIRQPANASAR
jgi:hypothetical protein